MSGFNLAELLPFYLDETDEHIAALNDSLLRLEQDPTDVKALQEAFRMFHSIKGASVVMGFQPVNQLTHHLESLFEELRSKKRELDLAILDLTFRCLDELRDYHRDLRANGQSSVDLSELVAQVIEYLHSAAPVANKTSTTTSPIQTLPADRSSSSPDLKATAATQPVATPVLLPESGRIALVVVFQPNLPLADMKARLVLNRLSTRARILSTDPPVERLDEVDSLAKFVVYLATEGNVDDLRRLADVEGVAQVLIEPWPINSDQRSLEIVDGANTRTVSVPAATNTQASVITKGPASIAAVQPPRVSSIAGQEPTAKKSEIIPNKTKIAETIRVESDRLDHLMNLAGELVITKARFVAIARGLDELFRGSNARALTSDTRERLESLTRGLEGLAEIKGNSSGNSLDRWSVHVRHSVIIFGQFRMSCI